MEKSWQEKKQLRQKQENVTLYKLFWWLGAAIVYWVITLLLKRYLIEFNGTDLNEVNFAIGLSRILFVFQFAGAGLTVAAAAWYVLSRKQGKGTVAPFVCVLSMAALSMTAVVAYHFREGGLRVLGLAAPVTAVLALIYFLYQREFFCNTLLTGVAIVALLVFRRYYLNHPRMIYFGFALVWIGLVAAAFLAWKLSQHNGLWGKYQVFSPGISYIPTYLTAGITALTLVVTLIAQAFGTTIQAYGVTAAYYAIFVLITWLFCMAVYYTVKLM